MFINKIFNRLNSLQYNKLFFLSPHLYSVGNFSEVLMFGLIKAKQENKKIFLLSPYDSYILFGKNICNYELFLLESKYIYNQGFFVSHLSKALVTMMILPIRIVDNILNIFGRQLSERSVVPLVGHDELFASKYEVENGFSWDVVDKYDWPMRINSDYNLSINNSKQKICKRKAFDFGINSSSWFVCLHVRESGFRKDKNRREYRNSNILNYIPAIKEITKAGGIVVRMGDSTMTPLPEMNNVIDYPFSENKSALMDLYLIKNCRFYIGTDSGIMDTAKMFCKDTLVINMVQWLFAYPYRLKDRGIYKYIYSKSKGRRLTFSEILNTDWKMQALFGDIDSNYELIENTPDDIKAAVSEYLCCHASYDFSLSKNQAKVNKKRIEMAKEIYKKFKLKDDAGNDEEVTIKYRIASRINSAMQGSICNSYLEKYIDGFSSDLNHRGK